MNDWYTLAVLALATYRLTRLVIKDTLPPVLWLRHHLIGGWRPVPGHEITEGVREQMINGVVNVPIYRASWVPEWLSDLWSCPWCVSGWIAGAVTAAADITIGISDPVFTGFAVWALGALLASREWS